ncbi:MAG: 5,6-dimethylbenzimidazole synthase [Nitrospirae bacterium]|nr:5,6-dimethylbenzimidazole synthase [Nitrospirota bacterium]
MNHSNNAFPDLLRKGVYEAIYKRRDIRRFLPDSLPKEVLMRILDAGHQAGSVGLMQPWNFILIASPEIRRRVKALFEQMNNKEPGKLTDPERKKLYRGLKLEGILEAPLNIAVTCDRRRDAPFVLGRAPMPETDLFSTCLAIQNMWLAARAEGIGIGWVSLLDRPAVERLLHLPRGVRLVAYLCIGYPVEFGPRPMLEEAGWKSRIPLKGLVYQDSWGRPAELFSQEAAPPLRREAKG